MRELPNKSLISIVKGCWFIFHEGDKKILAGGSPLTGKEWVYVNGVLVSEKQSFKITSKHVFQIGGRSHEIEFHIPELFKGKFECSLYSDGQLLGKYRSFYKYRFRTVRFLTYIAMGAGFWVSLRYWEWPYWTILPFATFGIVIASVWAIQDVVIERVES